MPAEGETHVVTEAICIWGGYEPSVRADCHATAVRPDPGGWLIIDPLPMKAETRENLLGACPVQAIVCLSATHERNCLEWSETTGAPIYTSKDIAAEFAWPNALDLRDAPFASMVEFFPLPGGALHEMALLVALPAMRHLVVADAIIHLSPEGPEILPAKYCTNRLLLEKSLKNLVQHEFDAITFGHGLPLRHGAKQKVTALIL